MSVGEFRVGDYTIRLYQSLFTIHKHSDPSMSLRIGVIDLGGNDDVEDLQITVHSELHATVETTHTLMRVIYYEPRGEDEGNGQIEVSVKIPGNEIASWLTLVNGLPRELIFTAVAILNGDDYPEQYRVRRNNEGQVVRNNVNDPGFENENVPGPALGNNGNEPSSNNGANGRNAANAAAPAAANNKEGGRRSKGRTRRYKKKGR